MDASALDGLRARVSSFLEGGLYDTAIFLGNKLVSMGGADAQDVYLLARAYSLAGRHRRVVHLLCTQHPQQLQAQVRCRYLASKCLVETQEWEGALETARPEPAADEGASEYASAMQLLRGKIFDALEERKKAVAAYRSALKLDCYCFEAFDHLTRHGLLTTAEEAELLAKDMSFGAGDEWLRLMYQAKLGRHQPPAAKQNGLAKTLDMADGADGAGQVSAFEVLGSLETRFGLKGNVDVLTQRAETHFYQRRFLAAYNDCKAVRDSDLHNLGCLPIFLCALVELQRKNELFLLEHQLVDSHPQEAVAWFAVGCYYYMIPNFDSARRYFEKATHMDSWFAPAWLGLGIAYASQDENDQALSAFRTAERMFRGCHLCPLFIGMECVSMSNLRQAQQYFDLASGICNSDPLVFNEMGCLCFKNGDFPRARDHFLEVLRLCGDEVEPWHATLFNLGHVYRKLGQYSDAIKYYKAAMHVTGKNASVFTALGFAYHLNSDVHRAIEYYHASLGIMREDLFASTMLAKCLEDCQDL